MNKLMLSSMAIVLVVAVAGCGKKAQESVSEKIMERAMEQQGLKGKVDIKDNQMTIQTKDGTVSYSGGEGTKVPDNFPKDVSIYAGAKVLTSVSVPNGFNLTLQTKDSVDKVAGAYKSSMTGAGWKEEMSMNQGEQTMLAYKKDKRTTTIIASRSSDQTQVVLTTVVE